MGTSIEIHGKAEAILGSPGKISACFWDSAQGENLILSSLGKIGFSIQIYGKASPE